MKTNTRSLNAIWLGAGASLALLLLANTASAQWSGSPNIYYNSGNVGIGTATPTERLHVYNSAGHTYILADSPNANHSVFSLRSAGTETGAFYRPAGTNDVRIWSGADRITVLNSNGNVGIGTTSPAYALDVNGSLRVTSGNHFHLTRTGTNRDISLSNSSNSDNLGLMTAYPSSGTDVLPIVAIVPRGAGAYGIKSQLSLYNTDFVADSNNVERLQIAAMGSKFTIYSNFYGTGANRPIDIYASGTSGQLYLNTNGNVGIGTATPSTRLHVAGSVTVDGNIAAKYQDMAEWVPTSEQLQAGTVVVLDTTKSNQVVRSTQAYDTRVAGVISAQPGITLGESGEGKVLVATTGRVLVNVDATNGPIRIGDLLVTSDVPGLAMKSEPIKLGRRLMHMPGTLIGKALEPLEKGSGKILVLLSLQ